MHCTQPCLPSEYWEQAECTENLKYFSDELKWYIMIFLMCISTIWKAIMKSTIRKICTILCSSLKNYVIIIIFYLSENHRAVSKGVL